MFEYKMCIKLKKMINTFTCSASLDNWPWPTSLDTRSRLVVDSSWFFA